LLQVGSVALSLALGRPTRRDDTYDVLKAFRPDNHHQSASNWTDADQALLRIRVKFVKDFKTIDVVIEQLCSFLE
jgi:hypothetical protein